jgi:DNA-binding response OmpR family regulator
VESAENTDALLTRAAGLHELLSGDESRSPTPVRAVLVIEDDPVAAVVLCGLVESLGVDTHQALTAKDARQTLRTHAFDLILLDLHLPDGDGRDLLLELKADAAYAHVPVIVSTSDSADLAESECLALGAAGYLRKPLNPRRDAAIIREHLDSQDHSAPDEADQPEPTTVDRGEAATPDGARNVTVLLVEDDPLSAALVEHRLGLEGWEVVHFADGGEAFAAIQDRSFTVAILDIKLPGMDGFEFLDRSRDLPSFRDVPIFLLTGMGKESDIVRGFQLGATDYIVKPFSPIELLARLRRAVEAGLGEP